MKTLLPLFSVALFVSTAFAQIQLVDGPSTGSQLNLADTYSQGFDIQMSTPSHPWIENEIPGWYTNSLGIALRGAFLSLGPDDGGGDRALGAAGAFGGDIHFALRLQNLSSATLSAFALSFDGEQWSEHPNTPRVPSSLHFSYQIFPPGDNSAALFAETPWTYVPELEFLSPQILDPIGRPLDGNDPATRTAD